MLCEKCGAELPQDAAFCEQCGTPVASKLPSITKGQDGKFRWQREINLLKDPTIVVTVLKITVLSTLVPLAVTIIAAMLEGSLAKDLPWILRLFFMVVGIVTGLTAFGYYLVFVPFRGAAYPVVFEMDDKGINHLEMPKRQDRAALLAWLGILAGIMAGSPSAVGANLIASSRKQLYTDFKQVRKIHVYPKRNLIKLTASNMTRNLIFAPPGELQFVLQHIASRSPKASIK